MRIIVFSSGFSKKLQKMISERKIQEKDFEDFKKSLVEDPEQGDLIQGTGGCRKIRIKSSSKGKRGGFRVCYLDAPEKQKLFFLQLYPKNEKEDLTAEERKALKQFSEAAKRG